MRFDVASVVGAVAGAKIVIGFVGWGLGEGLADTTATRYTIYLAHVIAFGAVAIMVTRGGGGDARARLFGACCLLVASLFADRLILRLGARWDELSGPANLLVHLQVEALLPFMLWGFAAVFPRPVEFGWTERIATVARRVTATVAIVLIILNLLVGIGQTAGWAGWPIAAAATFGRLQDLTLYQPTLFALIVPAVIYLVWKTRLIPASGRRRVWLFLMGIAVGTAPVWILVLVITVWPTARAQLTSPPVLRWLDVLVYTGTLSIPFTTGYAILVHRALDVRLVVRKAVRYAFARYTLLVATATPIVIFAFLLFSNRAEPLSELMVGTTGVLLVTVGGVSLVGLLLRGRVLRAIDRRFFREQYDAAQILHDLVHGSRTVHQVGEFEELLLREVDRAFHLDTATLLVRRADEDLMVSPSDRMRPLGVRTALASLLDATTTPLDVDQSRPDPVVAHLPFEEREWLADGGFQLLVPLLTPSDHLIGILALGDKRSELPFSSEDRKLLATVASAAAAVFEERFFASVAIEPPDAEDRTAVECPRCGIVSADDDACRDCTVSMEQAAVPAVLHGKFRFEIRLGSGGMGVVYRATDLHLGRAVAIKTLPRIAPAFAARLRREARVMAAVSHANLAVIYGVEFFHGTPMLVVEYLAGGTLADKLRGGPLPWVQAVHIGMTLANVADRIHRAGILHRDIKPSNVGFTTDGMAKLLDFGLARAHAAGQAPLPRLSLSSASMMLQSPPTTAGHDATPDETFAGALVGTAPYLAPEAVAGQAPSPSFDLWSICLVVYESVAGTNPLCGQNLAQTLYRISTVAIPDIRDFAPSCPASLATFLARALHVDPSRRPSSGRELGLGLRNLAATAGLRTTLP